jgi:hypothetical protein
LTVETDHLWVSGLIGKPGALSYTWSSDLDVTLGLLPYPGDEIFIEGWETAHKAFLLVDELRPSIVVPSIRLTEMLLKAGK